MVWRWLLSWREELPDLWEYVSAFAGVLCSAWVVLAAPDKKTPPAVLVAIFGVSTLTAKLVSRLVEKRAKAKKEVDAVRQLKRVMSAILDEMHREYFANESGEEKYKHRITLFVCEEPNGREGEGKYLKIFSRSGVYQNSTRTWPVDDNDPDRCRGVAGKIWYHRITDIKIAECTWPANQDQVAKARYAASLDITIEEAESLNVKSRTFAGAPVMLGGRTWGVLLLDSLKDDFIADKPRQKGLLNRYVGLITRVLTETGT